MAIATFGLYNTIGLLAGLVFAYAVGVATYNLFFHPLRRFPGPILMRAYRAPYCYKLLKGTLPLEMLDIHKKYGPVVRVAPDELAFHDSRAWKDIMGHRTGGALEFDKAPKFFRSDKSHEHQIASALREDHAAIRRCMSYGFSERSMREQEPLITKYVDLFIRSLRERSGEKAPEIDITAWYNFTTFDVIGDLAFGEPFGSLENSDYHPWIRAVFYLASFITLHMTGAHYPLLKTILFALVPEHIKRERQNHEEFTNSKVKSRLEMGVDRPDLIEGLLKKKDDWNMTFDKLSQNCSVLIVAGSETTATLLSGVTYYLLMNPHVLKKLTDEVRSAFKEESEINFTSASNLPYLLACLEEGLRRYPPVPSAFPRVVPPGGAEVAGQFIPEDTTVTIYQWAMYHSEEHFKDPFGFHPERWIGDPAFADDDKEALQPFHVGPRNCIGRNLAYAEMRVILARVLWNFDLELSPQSRDWVKKQKIYLLWNKAPLYVHLMPARRS